MSLESWMKSMEVTDPSYLGDGAYIGHDGYQLWVFAERDCKIESVALDGSALHKLLAYAKEKTDWFKNAD